MHGLTSDVDSTGGPRPRFQLKSQLVREGLVLALVSHYYRMSGDVLPLYWQASGSSHGYSSDMNKLFGDVNISTPVYCYSSIF